MPDYGSLSERAGSREVAEFIEAYQPKLHFCGHAHEEGQELEAPGHTRSFVLHEVNFRKQHKLNPGCIAIVKLSGEMDYEVSILDEPWMMEYRRDNFRGL